MEEEFVPGDVTGQQLGQSTSGPEFLGHLAFYSKNSREIHIIKETPLVCLTVEMMLPII